MLIKNVLPVLFATLLASIVSGQSDYLDPLAAPDTVYEQETTSPQNMDFDADNNMFVAHSGWYQDRLIHYYKFRIFAPSTYPGVIAPGVEADAVPLQNIYFVSTTNDFSGVVGKPIIEFHTSDGLGYSDFMVVNFVAAPADYTEDSFKSVGDIMASGAAMTASSIVMNIPVVPTGATLQHPMKKGIEKAPIQPVPVFYKGAEVWTYVFEVNDESAADFFAYTRSEAATQTRASTPLITGFEIPVLKFFATPDAVTSIPIWHVNQFNRGVTVGVNGGGPDPAGMRNIIEQDRPDPGYSPLWQIWWATEMPINYKADQLSNSLDATSENGFEFFVAPMFVNCPDIGLVGTEMNPMKETEFMTSIDQDKEDSFYIIGSHPSVIMQGDVEIKFMVGDELIGTTKTNMMGGYEYELMMSDLPEDAMMVKVMTSDGTEIRTVMIEDMDGSAAGIAGSSAVASFLLLAIASLIL